MIKIFTVLSILLSAISVIDCKPLAFIQDQDVLSTLAELSDPSDIHTMEDLEKNVMEIKSIFGDLENQRGFVDPRGAFAAIYQVTTSKGLSEIVESENGEGPFEDPAMVRCFAVQFGKLYLKNLHGHLTGGPVSEGWNTYYRMAASPDIHILQIMGAGANVHINLDLTTALQTCDAPKYFKDDFMEAGKPLVQEIPTMAKDLESIYQVDQHLTYGLFRMYFIGKAGNIIFKLFGLKGNSTNAIFQTLRWMGFRNHKTLSNLHDGKWYTIAPHIREALLRKRMRTIWGASNFVLNKWIHIAKSEGVDSAENRLGDIFKGAIKNIGLKIVRPEPDFSEKALIDLD
ncbi:DUF5995 family protein [bacterium]|nr:DUF5995 family protein [bacterium]